jgi:hypothetical protein
VGRLEVIEVPMPKTASRNANAQPIDEAALPPPPWRRDSDRAHFCGWEAFKAAVMLSGGRPKPADPPDIKTAAPTEIGSGGKADKKSGEISADELYRHYPILSRHYGLEAGGR